ncbi:MAG TPA: hypothetical protein VFX30_00790 [bacterium]|nr:hypothetical protein [bacterium]
MISRLQIERLRAVFGEYPEVELAYRFGSSVRHPDRAAKDVDIALLLSSGLSAERRFDIQSEIAAKAGRILGMTADVRILNAASPAFVYQVIKRGELISGDPVKSRDFIVKSLTRYFDYLPLHRFFVDRLQKRLGVDPHG